MNARSITFELAQKIRGPAMEAGTQPIIITTTPAGPGQHGGFKAEAMFKFRDYHLVGTPEVKPSMKAAKEEAAEAKAREKHEEKKRMWRQVRNQFFSLLAPLTTC